ncbi:calcium-independent phospholipase A2-gamma-like isoform X2 [Athalia rosae]|uniref:calcium-independent phospholipase A2-gamma-like isoform X2 n=1 Tax=Athalia rosae TaxID=37344 RepID=UPI002033812C|nr:calcium-independent phospholipase A2-gamma-like isoform X2 [Athalia rosae]
MSLSKNVRHCRRCISLTRQFTGSAASRDGTANVTTAEADKMPDPVNLLRNTKMSMPHYWKFLSQLKEYLNKSGYEKNLQLVINKDWINFFQRITYAQVESIRKFTDDEIRKAKSKASSSSTGPEQDTGIKQSLSVSPSVIEPKDIRPGEGNTPHSSVSGVEDKPKQGINPAKEAAKEQAYSLPNVLTGLMPKLSQKSDEKTSIIVPRWKNNFDQISRNSIASRTRHILTSIAIAESNASKWRRVEDLLTHIDQYPDARHYAIKEGAIRILLGIRRNTKDDQSKGAVREALAVLGHIDPLPGHGIRILSIDGGGIRGVLVIEMLKKLEKLTGKRVHEMFDYICGVSTGAILSVVLGGYKRKSLDEVSVLYKELSTKIFNQSALWGTSNLVWSHAYYDTSLWEKMLQEQMGDKDLIKTTRDNITPKLSAISTVVNQDRVMAYVFRNYTLPHRVESQYMGSYKHKLWEAVRASAAAPSYFEEFKLGDYLHQDGGILVNNPCAVAIHEAKQLWPNNPIQCVVSFGTGRTPNSLLGCDERDTKPVAGSSSWKDKFFKILDSATDTEATHTTLNDLLPDHIYYRFNPYLTEMLTMVEIRPEKLAQLEEDAAMYIRRNEEKFEQAAKALLKEKKLTQKAMDWVTLQKKVLGL